MSLQINQIYYIFAIRFKKLVNKVLKILYKTLHLKKKDVNSFLYIEIRRKECKKVEKGQKKKRL